MKPFILLVGFCLIAIGSIGTAFAGWLAFAQLLGLVLIIVALWRMRVSNESDRDPFNSDGE